MVSIIIPNWNGEKYLKDCLVALQESTYRPEEIIIMDNASTDSSYKWLGKYPDIVFKQLDKNYGFSIAVNEGVKIAKGEYILLLNNDTIIHPNFIAELVGAINQDSEIFSVASKMIQYNNQKYIDDAGDEYTLLGQAVQRGHNQGIECFDKVGEVFTSCAGAAIYRKSILDQIGLLDEKFFAYIEDVDLGYRARVHGYKTMYCPEAVVYHIGSATSKKQASTFTIRLINRNTIYMIYKNMPILQLLINMPFLLVGFLLKYLYYRSDKERKQAYIEAIKEGIKGCRDIQKTPFKWSNLWNYIKIQGWLIRGTYYFVQSKLKK